VPVIQPYVGVDYIPQSGIYEFGYWCHAAAGVLAIAEDFCLIDAAAGVLFLLLRSYPTTQDFLLWLRQMFKKVGLVLHVHCFCRLIVNHSFTSDKHNWEISDYYLAEWY
jgi:hypothetical protein